MCCCSLVRCSRDLVEPKEWQSRGDLQTYLGALAVMGRQKGGGRVFSKEKHSYFDHDNTHTLQQAHGRSGNRTAGDDEDDEEEGEARTDRAGRKAEQREEEKLQQDDEQPRRPAYDDEEDGAEREAEFSVPLGASADISEYICERLQSRQRERTVDISAPPIASHPPAYSTRGSVIHLAVPSSFSGAGMDEHKEHFSPRRSVAAAAHSRSGTTTPQLPHASPHSHSLPPRSPSAHTPLRLHPPAYASPALLDAQAQSLVTAIHFHHSEAMRQLHYTGGRQLARRTAAVVEGKNLFAGLKDKFHNTFTEIREMAEEDREEKRRESVALGKRKKGKGGGRTEEGDDATLRTPKAEGSTTRRPATSSSASSTSRPPAHPTLPSASSFRPATSAGLLGRQSSVGGGAAVVERRTWPDAFALPDSVDTYTRLAPIVRLPRQGNEANGMQPLSLASMASSPSMRGAAGRRASVSAPAGKSRLGAPAPITTGDLSALSGATGLHTDSEAGSMVDSARRAAAEGEAPSAVVRPPSVYMQQRTTHMRANFIRFLSHTEPQLWTPAVKRRDGELASGRERSKSRARASVIQTHSGGAARAS